MNDITKLSSYDTDNLEESIILSVIIPVYNLADYIEKCIVTILNQGIDGIEIILIDDGSTDESGSICDSLAKKDKRIKIIHKKNGGVNTARNLGLREAKGEWVTFVDGDDFIESNTFSENLQLLEKYVEADILQYPEKIYKAGLKTLWNGYPNEIKLLSTDRDKAKALIGENPIIPGGLGGKIYKKNLWNGIKLREDMQFCEDMIALPELFKKSRAILISNKGGYNYVVREGSATNSTFTPKKCLDVARLKYGLLKYAIENKLNISKLWFEATECAINAMNFCEKCEEITIILSDLQKYKKNTTLGNTKKIILKISKYISPIIAAKINKYLINLGKRNY